MSRPLFEQGLQQLQTEVLELGKLVDTALKEAMASLEQRNYALSTSVIENDKEINRLRLMIEEQALTLIATQQPVAHDLRILAATLNIVSELERMGDHAKGIAQINQLLKDLPLVTSLAIISSMGEKCSSMLKAVLEAFIHQNAEGARATAQYDSEIDALYDQAYQELLQIMINDPQTVSRATCLLWAVHNLERFGDRITNICERIIFVATGELVEIADQHHVRLYPDLFVVSAKPELEA
ncbi:MAG: phosphate signaling complex protein PhoU [Chloroflexota bacterium]|nr:phosphate signaling complex protein PhoU [Chloroflexota bacterium]